MNQGIGHMYVNSWKTSDKNLIIIAVNYAYEHPEDFRLILLTLYIFVQFAPE